MFISCMCALSLKWCPTLCNSMDHSLPGSSIHGISQASILKWVTMSFSRGIFQTQGSNLNLLNCRWIPYRWATGKAQVVWIYDSNFICESPRWKTKMSKQLIRYPCAKEWTSTHASYHTYKFTKNGLNLEVKPKTIKLLKKIQENVEKLEPTYIDISD